jgi:tetratricopeptide (TPR) repeat protein
LKRDAKRWDAHGNLGIIMARRGMLDEAIDQFDKSLTLNPNYLEAHINMGRALLEKGMLDAATEHYRMAVKLDPEDPRSRFDLGNVLFDRGMREEAIEQFEKSLEVSPGSLDARLMLGKVLAAEGKFGLAAVQYQRAMADNPNDLRAINDMAWLLSVCPSDEVRDGAKALEMAKRACAVTRFQDPVLMCTLAAAYAEVGEFSTAVATATKSLDLVEPRDEMLIQRIHACLEHYRNGKAYRSRL